MTRVMSLKLCEFVPVCIKVIIRVARVEMQNAPPVWQDARLQSSTPAALCSPRYPLSSSQDPLDRTQGPLDRTQGPLDRTQIQTLLSKSQGPLDRTQDPLSKSQDVLS